MKIVEQKTERMAFLSLRALAIVCAITLTVWSGRAFATTSSNADDAAHLIAAVRADRMNAVRKLVAAGADINACKHGDGTALIVASQLGNLAMAKALAGLGADVNAPCRGDGDPLIAASKYGNLEVIEWLLSAGAKINAVVPGDETALITAVRADNLPAVRYLVAHGADVNLGVMTARGEWRSPLNQARNSAIRNFLLSHGASPSNSPFPASRAKGRATNQ